MDEPTASLSQKEVDELFAIVRRLRDEGRGILFISHRFDDIFAISDRFVVFRDGAFAGEGMIEGADKDELVRMMAGRNVAYAHRDRPMVSSEVSEEPILKVEKMCHATP